MSDEVMSNDVKPVEPAKATSKPVSSLVDVKLNFPQEVPPYIFCANCCCMSNITSDFPSCLGISAEGICLGCIAGRVDVGKLVETNDDVVCIWQDSSAVCIRPGKTLCKSTGQVFCSEHRCALPCDAEVPFSCTVCFFELFRYDAFTTNVEISTTKIVKKPLAPPFHLYAPVLPTITRGRK